jgi:predicted anti-sigma-YlaC factor YlaD
MAECEQISERISGYIDGELTQQDRQRVELHWQSCPKCRQTYEKMLRMREDVGRLTYGKLSHDEWSRIMNDLTVRTSRGTGWLLYILGTLIVVGYGAYEFAMDDGVPALIKTGAAGIVVGTILLFVSVFRQRLIARKSDKYRDVQI